MSVGVSPPGTVFYAGNNLTLSCTIILNGGITESDVMVTRRWTKDGAVFTGVPGRVTVNEQMPTSSVFIRTVVFSPLSSSIDNGTFACEVTLTPIRPQFVNAVSRSDSISLAVRGKIIKHATPQTCSSYLCMWVVIQSLSPSSETREKVGNTSAFYLVHKCDLCVTISKQMIVTK